MGKLNVVMAFNAWTKECEPMGIFSGRYDWKRPEISGIFNNTIAIMSDPMAGDYGRPSTAERKSGAVPGILAYCPTAIPIHGQSLFRYVADHIADSNNDIEATVFVDGDTYKSVLACGSIEHFWVVTEDGSNPDWEKEKFRYRGWAESGDDRVDLDGGVHVREYRRSGGLDITEQDFLAEINMMEGEMNERESFESDLTDDDRRKMDHLFGNIEEIWAMFTECGKDMADFLDTARTMAKDMLPEGVDMAGLPDGMEEMLDTMNAPGMDAPASLGLVRMLANQLQRLTDMAVETKRLAKDTEAKLAAMDMAMCDSVKSMEGSAESMKSYTDEALSGLRRQLGLVILKQRLKSWIPVVCAVISAICCVITVIAR